MDTITTVIFPACRTKGKIGINEAAIYNSTSKGRPRYALTLNQDISAKIIDSGFEYASIRVNNCTSEHFLCFSNEPYGGIRYLKQGLTNKGSVSINSKPIVEYLTEALRLTFADGRAMLWISDNLSKIDQILTFKIDKRHE